MDRARLLEDIAQAGRQFGLSEAGVTGVYRGQPTFAAQQAAEAQRRWEQEFALEKQPEAVSAKEQYTNTLYNKLLGGQPLTDLEKAVLGIRESDPYQSAVTLAQKDPNWLYADTDEKKQVLIDFYYRLLTGQTAASPAQGSPAQGELDWARQQGLVK